MKNVRKNVGWIIGWGSIGNNVKSEMSKGQIIHHLLIHFKMIVFILPISRESC